jgi:predicted dehydrogenase
LYKAIYGYRTADNCAPQLPVTEALHTEAKHFLECINTGRAPDTDGAAGLRIVRLLEAATQSLAQQGRPVPVDATAAAL